MRQSWGGLSATEDEVSVDRSVDLGDKYKTIAPDLIKMLSRQMKRPGVVPPAAPVMTGPIAMEGFKKISKGVNPLEIKKNKKLCDVAC